MVGDNVQKQRALDAKDARDQRIRRLKRMKALATGLLVAMAALYALTFVFSQAAIAPYVRAFAEAAMVGACADWFAVTALFRRPLGLPIPHTAIIPRNKDRIGRSLGAFIVDNFLSPRVLDAKLQQLELAAWGGQWLRRPENARAVARQVVNYGPEVVRALPPAALEDLAGSIALAVVKAVPAAPAAARALAILWNEGRAQPWIEQAAAFLGDYLADHPEVIVEKVQGQSWKWLPSWVDRAIAKKITSGAHQLLLDLRQPDHPWRLELGQAVEGLIAQLSTDPAFLAKGEALKQRLLDDPKLGEQAHRLWIQLQVRLQTEWSGGSAGLENKIQSIIQDLGVWLQEDLVVQRTLNSAARSIGRSLLAPRRHEIGGFVASVVESWDARSVVDRLELQVGPDLQYIRVNGTLVGGVVGLLIFAATRWIANK